MPDHIHALLVFQRDQSISRVIGDWKHFHAKESRVELQEGFFDHRLRDDERREQSVRPRGRFTSPGSIPRTTIPRRVRQRAHGSMNQTGR